jgi:hypothetical protein
MSNRGDREGKACDAVLRWIEAREGSSCRDLQRHDHAADPKARIELTCTVGGSLFALEHSLVEPFEGHAVANRALLNLQSELRSRLTGQIPAEDTLRLFVPGKALLGIKNKKLAAIFDAIAAHVIETVPSMPAATFGDDVRGLVPVTLKGVPFGIQLHRSQSGPFSGSFVVEGFVTSSLESDRVERIRRTYEEKCPKLEKYKDKGARTILVIEEDDIGLTNHSLVAEAIRTIEAARSSKPDEIYLVDTRTNPWFVHRIRLDSRFYDEFEEWGDRIHQFDPKILLDVING